MLTQRLYDALIDQYFRGKNVLSLAEWSGLSSRTLWRWLEAERANRLGRNRTVQHWRNLNCIGIDELFWRDRIVCVIINLETGELLDLLPDRNILTVVASLSEINDIVSTLRDGIWQPVVVTDMWEDYRLAIQAAFQNRACHITDRFHLQAKISEDLTAIIREVLPVSRQRPRYVSMARTAFHTRQVSEQWLTELPPDQRHQVTRAIRLAIQLNCVWECPDEAAARQAYARWRWKTVTSGLPNQPYGRLIHLFEGWDDQIFGYFRPVQGVRSGKRVTGAMSEAVNSRLRALERSSQRHTFNHFNPGDPHSPQQHFEAFWCTAMHTLNQPTDGHPITLTGIIRPLFTACPTCGSEAITVEWRQTKKCVRNVPWGEAPVQYVLEEGLWKCATCWQEGVQQVPADEFPRRYTPALSEYVQRKRLSGWSVRRVARATGLSRQIVQQLTPDVEPILPPAPAVLGIQVWRWRRARHWVLTDVERGLLIDIVPVERGRLTTLLTSAWGNNISTIVLAHPGWKDSVPAGTTVIIDRFTATLPVQRALQEVQRRFTDSVSVTARRQPAYHRHRQVILASPDSQGTADRQRLEAWLVCTPELRVARELRDQFHSHFELTDGHEIALRTWLAHAHQRTSVTVSSPLRRALHFGFRDAFNTVSAALPLIIAGMQSPAYTLASSRILLRHLREHPASQQPSLALLRHAALQAFGDSA